MAKALSIILTAALFVALAGCPKPAPADTSEAVKAVQARPAVAKVAVKAAPLTDAHCQQVQAVEDKLAREQARQATVRHWLIVAAVALGLFALVGGAGKFLAGGAAAAAWYGVLLVWVGNQIRWRTILVAAGACAGCIALAVWVDPVWGFVVDLGYLAVLAIWTFAVWELSCRAYTGAWTPDGLVRLPTGWSVAPKA